MLVIIAYLVLVVKLIVTIGSVLGSTLAGIDKQNQHLMKTRMILFK